MLHNLLHNFIQLFFSGSVEKYTRIYFSLINRIWVFTQQIEFLYIFLIFKYKLLLVDQFSPTFCLYNITSSMNPFIISFDNKYQYFCVWICSSVRESFSWIFFMTVLLWSWKLLGFGSNLMIVNQMSLKIMKCCKKIEKSILDLSRM